MIKIPSIKAIRLLLIVFSVIYITGCEKEDLNGVEPDINSAGAGPNHASSDQDVTLTSRDKTLDNVAKRLARSLEKEELRTFIKSEALKKFDGDFDILIALSETYPSPEENSVNILIILPMLEKM